jgi:hypothetical protein
MPAGNQRLLDERHFMTSLGAAPPLMQDFGERLAHLSVGWETSPLPLAVGATLGRLGLARQYGQAAFLPGRLSV